MIIINIDNISIPLSDNSTHIKIISKNSNDNSVETIKVFKDGSTWQYMKTSRSMEQLVNDYFENCKEDNGFDNTLIDSMCNEYGLNKSIFRSEIAFKRHKYIASH